MYQNSGKDHVRRLYLRANILEANVTEESDLLNQPQKQNFPQSPRKEGHFCKSLRRVTETLISSINRRRQRLNCKKLKTKLSPVTHLMT